MARYKYKRLSREPVRIIRGRLKGETGMAIGDTNLNMDYRVIVFRDNPRARNKTMGFYPDEIEAVSGK